MDEAQSAVLGSLRRACSELGLAPKDILTVSDIGVFAEGYGLQSPPGRAVAAAIGAKLANPGLAVLVTCGEFGGATLGHLIGAMRDNIGLACVVIGGRRLIDPVELALLSGAAFVARASCGEPDLLTELLKKAVAHKGFSLVDCLPAPAAGDALRLGVLREDKASPSYEALDPAIKARGPAVGLALELSSEEREALLQELRERVRP